MPPQPYAIATESNMEGHDAPQPVSPTSMSRPEEGLQHHPGVEYSIEYAETPQASTPYPEHNDLRRESIPWSTHPRNQDTRRSSLAQSSNSRQGSFPWDPSHSNFNAQTAPPSVARRGTTTTMSLLSENSPRDAISPDPVRCTELGSNDSSTDVPPKEPSSEVSEVSEVSVQDSRWTRSPYLRWANPRRKYWRYIQPTLMLCLLAVLIAMIVLYLKLKKNAIILFKLIITITQQAASLPTTDSALAAATIVFGAYFTSPSSSGGPHDTKLVYTTSSGHICIRTKTGGSWLSNIQCITNLSPKPHTPLAILDWLGGPSIYFINTANQLCGIDNIPSNNTWKLSSVAAEKVSVHPESQLATVTWLNGTSSWLYYQDTNSQLREYGIDDYRDTSWRGGATGPLGVAIAGSSIGVARYLINGSEVMEVFIQTTNDAIHGRLYMDSVWESDFYSVDGTTTDLSANAALTATAVPQVSGDGDEILLAWVSSSGFLNVQTRTTVNVTQYNAFSDAKQLVEGDGGEQPGLAAITEGGEEVDIYFADGEKILDLTGGDGSVGNMTSVDVTSL